MGFNITGDPAADRVLDESPFALLVGMLLDQQYPMEHAFRGPARLRDRLGTLDPGVIAATDRDELAEICARTPAIHRFPGSMATRLQELDRVVETEYDGDARGCGARQDRAASWCDGSRPCPASGSRRPGSSSRSWPSSWTYVPRAGRGRRRLRPGRSPVRG